MGYFRKSQSQQSYSGDGSLASLQVSAAALLKDIALVDAQSLTAAHLVEELDAGAANLKASTAQIEAILSRISLSQIGATRQVRQFQATYDIKRDAVQPDIVVTIFVLITTMMVEGLVGAGLFFADGKGDLFTSGLYGFAVALLNVAVGVCNGFVFGRGMSFRREARNPQPRNARIRFGAAVGFWMLTGVAVVMAFAAARVRATGSHSGILDFSEVGLAATFADYFGLMLMALGLVSAIVAIRKGWVGISDPIPEYAAIWKQADKEIRESAETAYEMGLDSLDDQYERLSERVEEKLQELERHANARRSGAARLMERISAHNSAVLSGKEQAQRVHAEEHAQKAWIDGVPHRETPPFDGSAYDRLVVTLPDLPLPTEVEEQIGILGSARQRLDSAYHNGTAAIEQGWVKFLAGVSGLSTTQAEKGE